jgi:predicted DNA-binding transcriptional regulator YafY
MKTDRLLRLLSIIELIRKQPGIKFLTLADEFCVTERTIRRDVGLLEKAGIPIQNYNGLRFLSDVNIPKFDLDPDETATLLLIINALSNFKLNIENIKKISSKLKKSVPEKMLDECENISEKILIDTGSKNNYDAEVLQTLMQVLQSQHKIKILYNSFSSNNKKWRIIEPYGIFFKRRAWYTAAYCHLRSDVRVFRCNRIEKIKHLKDSYSVPDDFKIKKFLENSWELMQGDPAKITVKFSQEVTPLIKETTFHKKETKKEVADGIIYEVEVANWKEVYIWILSFGKNAEIIAPEWLRERCGEELREMGRKYEE